MDVGQVQFSVTNKGLEENLKAARELEEVLNRIDQKSVGVKSSAVAKKGVAAANGAANAAKQGNEELRIANQNIKRGNLGLKMRYETSKRIARLDKDEAKRLDAIARMNIKNSNRRLKERLNTAKRTAKVENESIKAFEKAARAPYEFQHHLQQSLVNAGAQMQTLGATLQRVTSPFTNVYRGLTMGIGYRMLGTVMDSVQGAFSRYDTMRTYNKVLSQIGLNAETKFSVGMGKAKSAIDNLEEAVLGLPTGLDEIVASMRVYAGMTNDVEKATKMAIAANNAFIAGGENETRQRMAERQLQNLLSNGELTAQQWNSLQKNMAVGFNAVGKEMGYSDDNINKFLADMKSGQHTVDEFVNAFIKVGTEGSIANAAQVMKQTWNAVTQNVQNRLNALGENTLKTLDEVFVKMDGRNFLQHVLGVDKNGEYIGGGIRGAIDNMSESIQNWIRTNPDVIERFFNNISKIDLAGIASGFGKFAVSMGRFYAFLGRIAGNGNFVRAMLDLNLLGKFIQTAGGITKGTAWITSWVATIAKFGKLKGIEKVAVKAGHLFHGGKAITGAVRTVGNVALTWQDVVSKGLSIAAIPAMAWSLKEVALALQEFSKVDLNVPDLAAKVASAGGAITAFAGLAAVLGHLTASNAFGWITTAGTAIGIAEVASIAKTMKWVGEGLTAIANAEVPDYGRLETVMSTMNMASKYFTTRNPIEAIGRIFDTWTKSAEFKSIKTMTDAFKGIQEMTSMKMEHGWKHSAKKRLGAIVDFAADLEEIIVDADKKLMKKSTPNQAFTKGSKTKSLETSFALRKERMREFADMAESMAGGIGSMDSALQSINSLNVRYQKMKDSDKAKFDWEAIRKRISRITNAFYGLAVGQNGEDAPLQKLRAAAKKVEGADYAKITEALGELPKIIGKIDAIQKRLNESSMFKGETATVRTNALDLENKIKPLFDALDVIQKAIPDNVNGFRGMKVINNAMTGIQHAVDNLKKISSIDTSGINLSNIQGLADKLAQAFGTLEGVGNKQIKIAFEIGEISGVKEIVKAVEKEIEKLRKKIDRIDGKITKKVDVTITSSAHESGDAAAKAQRIIALMRNKVAGLSASISKDVSIVVNGVVNGNKGEPRHKHMGGRLRPLYRAHGGEIFATRGTDTIPAMLTEGEWVINRRASSRIGDDALWRLNHMDIAGAVRSLSTRMGNSVRNVTNNTRNATVNINNYNTPSTGVGRASGWMKRLNV